MSESVENNNPDENKPETFSRAYVEELRQENAKHRNDKNAAVEAAKAEVTESFQTKIQELESQLNEKATGEATARTETNKLKAAIAADISNDKIFGFADLLKGETEDELKSHADELKELFGTSEEPATKKPATDPSQGSSGKHIPLNGDPLLDAITRAVGK